MSGNLDMVKQKVAALSSEARKTEMGIDLLCQLAWEEGVRDPQQLRAIGEETLASSRELPYCLGEAQSLRNVAYWYFVFGNDIKMSASLAQDGVFLSESCQNEQTTAELFDILAMCFTQLGAFERSLEYTRKSMQLFKQTGDQRGLAWSYRNMGNLYKDATDLEQAEIHYQKALDIFQDIGHFNGMARVYNNLGELYAALEDYEQALSYLLKSLDSDEKSGLHGLGYSGSLLSIGAVYNCMGDTEQAFAYLQKSQELLEQYSSDNPQGNINHARLLLEMGKVHRQNKQLKLAIEFFQKTIQSAEVSGDRKLEYEAYRLVSQCYDTLQEYHFALQHYKKYTALQEQVLTGESNLKLDNMNMSQEIVLVELEKNAQRRLKEETEKILLRVLPQKVMEELRDTGKVQPQHFEQTTVLFSDFVGFTQLAKTMSAEQLVSALDLCFSAFDKTIQCYGVERMKTIGDGYMAVAGVPSPVADHAIRCVLAGLEIIEFIQEQQRAKQSQGQEFWNVRVGLNSGPLVAGIIGHSKFAYDVWGETVNIASRMEAYGQQGCVNVSASTHQLIETFFECEPRGAIEVKHKQQFEMYLVHGIKPQWDNQDWKLQFQQA